MDNSEIICKKYKKKYPNNIIYIKQKNQGVSAARNKGLKYAEGKYVVFLDSDDLFKKNVFKIVYNSFEKNLDIDVISCRQKQFEASNRWSNNDYIYKKGNRVVDINNEYYCPIFSVTSAFFRKSALKNLKFDTSLSYGEDAKFICEIVLNKEKYIALKDAINLYRIRKDTTSATQKKLEKDSWYKETIDNYYKYIYDLSFTKYNKLIPFIQYTLLNGVFYRLLKPIPKIISEEVKKSYIEKIIFFIKNIDDDVIITFCRNKIINLNSIMYIFYIKYGKQFYNNITINKKNNIII